MRVIGLMSGTSFDGIEAAAADLRLDGDDIRMMTLGELSAPYAPEVRAAITAALPPATTTAEAVTRIDTVGGQAFAKIASQANDKLCDGTAELVVSHGQTIFHWVERGRVRGSLQLGQPAWIAEKSGLPVVADLRSRDIAAGGQGCTTRQLFDVLLLGSASETRAALNLGGIANLTIVPAQGAPFAFDVGPANALIDAAVTHFTGGRRHYDRDGRWAAGGRVDQPLLRRLMADAYYGAPPPKSTGKEHFHVAYLLDALGSIPPLPPADVVATVTRLTAETIARDCHRYGVRELLASGGGVRNATLMAMLADAAAGVRQLPI